MANSFGYICDFSDGFAAVKKEEKELGMSLALSQVHLEDYVREKD